MRQETDYGTPETQAHIAMKKLKQKGLDHLYNKGTIDATQLWAGRAYHRIHSARFRGLNVKSQLGHLAARGENAIHEPASPSKAWGGILDGLDLADSYGKVTGILAKKSFYSRKNLIIIIQHVAGRDEWGIEDVQRCFGVCRNTASKYISIAFDKLIESLDEAEADKG